MKYHRRVQPRFFTTPTQLRRWLARHHARAPQLLVGSHKRRTARASLSWPEAVDEALCFGWIDGVRRGLDDQRYCIRFTPRRPGSTWSAVNIAKARALTAAGRMRAAGRAAFASRTANRSGRYCYEQRPQRLVAPYAGMLQRNRPAHTFLTRRRRRTGAPPSGGC